MDEKPNGRRLERGDPLIERILAREAEYRAQGKPYPRIRTDCLADYPHVRFGRTPFHAETLDRLIMSGPLKMQPVPLPPDFIITGDERLPHEPEKFYKQYLVYRDLGTKRSLTQAAKTWLRTYEHAGGGPKATDRNLSEKAAKWRWYERATAYDSGREIEARLTTEQLEQQQMREHIERRQTYLDNEYKTIERMGIRIHQMLSFPVDHEEVTTEYYEDGRPKAVTHIHPVRWNYASLAQIQAEVTKLARLHFGLATSNANQRIEDNRSDATDKRERPMSVEDREAHEFAAARAEEAYFAALDEYKQMKSEKPLVATIAETAAG